MSLFKSLSLILSLFLAFGINANENKVNLLLHEKIYVVSNMVSVADVVNVKSLNKHTLLVLQNLIIAKSPIPGYHKTLSRKHIQKVLKGFKDGLLYKLNVTGSETVIIKRKSKKIKSEDYVQKAEELLKNYLDKNHIDITLQALGNNKDIFVPDTDIEFVLSTDNLHQINKRVCAMLEIKSAGNFFARKPVWFKVEGKFAAYVFDRNAAKNTVLQKNILKKSYIEISSGITKPLLSLDKLNSFVTNKSIIKGQMLTQDLLKPKLDVMRGENVEVVVNVGNVTLYTSAIAKQSGSIGEIVELVNKKNNEVFKGVVINENYVSSM